MNRTRATMTVLFLLLISLPPAGLYAQRKAASDLNLPVHYEELTAPEFVQAVDLNNPPVASGPLQDQEALLNVGEVRRGHMAGTGYLGVVDVGVENPVGVRRDEVIQGIFLADHRFTGIGVADIKCDTRAALPDQLFKEVGPAGPAPGQILEADLDSPFKTVVHQAP